MCIPGCTLIYNNDSNITVVEVFLTALFIIKKIVGMTLQTQLKIEPELVGLYRDQIKCHCCAAPDAYSDQRCNFMTSEIARFKGRHPPSTAGLLRCACRRETSFAELLFTCPSSSEIKSDISIL